MREATLEESEADDKEPEPNAISELAEQVKRTLRDQDSSQMFDSVNALRSSQSGIPLMLLPIW